MTRWGATLVELHKDDIRSEENLIVTASAAAASVIREPGPSSRNEPLEISDQ